MQIQLAIDRVPLSNAIEIAVTLRDVVDIIEVGTSLIKDYGMMAVKEIKSICAPALLLADMKVMDEGEYEFQAAYEHGADYITVMGAAADATIQICGRVAAEYQKPYVIDLMGIPEEKIKRLARETSGILCFHMPSDEKGGLDTLISQFENHYRPYTKGAIAGGVTQDALPFIKQAGFSIAVVGGAITKQENMRQAAIMIKEAAN